MRNLFLTLVFLLLSTACSTTSLKPSSNGEASVRKVSGQAEIATSGVRFHQARSSERVQAGAIARTGLNGQIDFFLGRHGGVLTLHPDSTLKFEQIGVANDSRVVAVLDLTRGRVTGDTLKLPAGTKVRVKTLGGIHEIP